MTDDTPAIPIPGAEMLRGRRFGIYDLMVLIAGAALLFAFENNKIRNLTQQFVELCKAIAAYFGFLPARPYGPPQYLTEAIANYWSGVEWYGVQAAELLVLVMTAVFLLMRVRQPRPPIRHLRQKSRCEFARFTVMRAKSSGQTRSRDFRQRRRPVGCPSTGQECGCIAQMTQFDRVS